MSLGTLCFALRLGLRYRYEHRSSKTHYDQEQKVLLNFREPSRPYRLPSWILALIRGIVWRNDSFLQARSLRMSLTAEVLKVSQARTHTHSTAISFSCIICYTAGHRAGPDTGRALTLSVSCMSSKPKIEVERSTYQFYDSQEQSRRRWQSVDLPVTSSTTARLRVCLFISTRKVDSTGFHWKMMKRTAKVESTIFSGE